MPTYRYDRLVISALVLLMWVAACASTQITAEWSDPEAAGTRLHKPLVIAVTRQTSTRRLLEDAFVTDLKSAGVDAVQSYRYITPDDRADEPTLRKALQEAGADSVLITRLLGTERRTEVSPGFYGPGPIGFYGWYSTAWVGYYEPPQVYQYDVITTETSVYNMSLDKVIWSGTAQTTSSGELAKQAKEYAAVILDALRKKKLV